MLQPRSLFTCQPSTRNTLALPTHVYWRHVSHTRSIRQVYVKAVNNHGQPSDAPVSTRHEDLWKMQNQLWDRQMQQWDHERQAWREREASLQAEISSLRQEVHYLLESYKAALGLPSTYPSPTSTPTFIQNVPSTNSKLSVIPAPAIPPISATPSSLADTASSSPSQASSLPAGAAFVASGLAAARSAVSSASDASDADDDEADSIITSSTSANWEDLFPNDAKPADSMVSSVASSLAAAFAAVDAVDVVQDDLAFLTKPDAAAEILYRGSSASASSASASQALPAVQASHDDDDDDDDVDEEVSMPLVIPDGPRPVLALGADDIQWMHVLHSRLIEKGFSPGDDDVEGWFFGDSTLDALLTYQACEGLPETGVVDEVTWGKLLEGSSSSSSSSSSSVAVVEEEEEEEEVAAAAAPAAAPAAAARKSWPVLMETDGGREVHHLQVGLSLAGYSCDEDEMSWWQFGPSTQEALRCYQACKALPETGVCDERVWRALLGSEATPADVYGLASEETAEFARDKSGGEQGAVWLVGEQRWSYS